MTLQEITRSNWIEGSSRQAWIATAPRVVRVLVVYECMAQSVELLMDGDQLCRSIGRMCRDFLAGEEVDGDTVVELAREANNAAQNAMEHEVLKVDKCTSQVLGHASLALAASVVYPSPREFQEFHLGEDDAIDAACSAIEWMLNFAESAFELPEASRQSHELLDDEIDAQFEIITELTNFTRVRNFDWDNEPFEAYRVWRDSHPDDYPI